MATVLPARGPRLRAERIFYSGMALVMLAMIFAGFAPNFYLRGAVPSAIPLQPMTPLVVAHGVVFSAWVLLFAAQAGLVSAGRTDLHRRLGMAGLPILLAMIVIGLFTSLHGVARASGPPIVPPLAWLAIPLLDIPVFAGLIGAALWLRRRPQVHKRLMLIAMVGMLSPAAGRLPPPPFVPVELAFFVVPDLFLLALVGWDLASRGRLHPATLIGGAILIGSQAFRLAVWQTDAWLAFAGWAAGLVQ